MDQALRPIARRLGVTTEAGLRAFVKKANDAIWQVDMQRRDADIERRKAIARSTVFASVEEFSKIVGWPDCEQSMEPEDFAIILHSAPRSKFYGKPKLALEAALSVASRVYMQIGTSFETAAEKSMFQCSVCHEFKPLCCAGTRHYDGPWLFETYRCTVRRDQHWTRHTYGDEWHKDCSYGWVTPLCQICLRNVCDDVGNHDVEKEVDYMSRIIRTTSRNIRKNAA